MSAPFDKLRVTWPFDKLRVTWPFDKLRVTCAVRQGQGD